MVQPSTNRLLVESQLGAANGPAKLGSDAKLPDAQLPARLQDAALDGKVASATAGKLDSATAATTYALKSEAGVDFTAARVDRLGLSKLTQSQARALKDKADAKPMPSATTTVTLSTGERAVIYLPAYLDRSLPVPLVIHFHGADTNATTETQWQPLWQAAQANGFAVATCDFHGNGYGSPTVLADAQAVFDKVLELAPINGVILSGESMGGIAVLNALTHKTLPNVLGAYLAQPIVSLRHRYDNGRMADIKAGYGIAADGSDYDTKTAGYDPNLEPGSKFGGVPFYITSSPSDTAALKTPFIDNFIARVDDYSPVTFVAATGSHGDASHFIPANYVAKLKEWAAGLVTAPPPYNFTTDAALVSDFDAATLALADGAAVTSWAPARGTVTAPLAQATTTYQPTYTAVETGLNNKPSVTFGSDDFLDTGAWATALSTPTTFIEVVKLDTAQAAQPYRTGRNGVYMYAATTATGISIQTASTGGAVAKASAGALWRIIVSVYDGAGSRLYVNSKTAATGTTGTTAEGVNAKVPGIKLNTSSAGTAGTGNTPRFAREAVLSRALTDAEVGNVLDSLASTYGITLA